MREIKFRAWRKDNQQMLELYSLPFGRPVARDTICSDPEGTHETLTNDELILKRCTGLKNKNGKEVCERGCGEAMGVQTFGYGNLSVDSRILSWVGRRMAIGVSEFALDSILWIKSSAPA